jgi:hypothetical protein
MATLHCPSCSKLHIDEGEFATRPHRTHRCVDDAAGKGCGHEWRIEGEPRFGVDSFCPRHGKASRPVETPGLRCDCLDVIKDAVGSLRRGKWASASLADEPVSVGAVNKLQERIDRAVDEALMAGYRLGLAGGAPATRVHTCTRCCRAWLSSGGQPATLIKSNGLCLSCAYKGKF